MPSNPRPAFGRSLVGLARRWRRHIDDELAGEGLSDAIWVPLVHLRLRGEPMHQKELAATMGLDASSLVRVIDLLEARGFIQRLVDPQDRRARNLRLTEAGEATVAPLLGRLAAIEGELLADVSDDELATALSVFARVERRLAGRATP